MKRDKFIKEHILPYEDDKTKVDYYEGNIAFDDDYLHWSNDQRHPSCIK